VAFTDTEKEYDNTDKQNSGLRNNKGSQMTDRKVIKLQYI